MITITIDDNDEVTDLGHVVRSVGDGGGDEELEEEHEVLQHDDQEHGLGAGHVREQAVHWTRQT